MKNLKTYVIGLSTLFGCSVLAGAQSQPQDLFFEIPLEAQFQSEFKSGPTEIRRRQVQLNHNLVEAMFARKANRTALINLFPGISSQFEVRDVNRNIGGGAKSWMGHANDMQGGQATLIINGARMSGHIQLGTQTFVIRHLQDDIYNIVELDLSVLPQEGPALIP